MLALSRYQEAARLSLCAAARARAVNDERRLAKVLNNLGVARLYQQECRQAYEAFQEARELAHRLGLAEVEASAWSNLATLYGMLSAWPAADHALERALALMPSGSRFRPAVLAQRVRLAARRTDLKDDNFSLLWRDAMDGAESQGDWQVQRHLWDELASFHLEAGRLERAEAALANSFRLVILHRLTDPESLWMLAGRLRLAQGRPAEALQWLSRVRATGAAGHNPVSFLRLAAAEARAEAAVHGSAAALAACRRSWPLVLAWRDSVLPDPAVEMAADVAMTELVDIYAQNALTAAGNRTKSIEAWAVVEQTRALGMLRRKQRQAAGPDIGAQPGAARGLASRQASGPITGLPLRLASQSAAAGGTPAAAPAEPLHLLRMVQQSLSPRQALFTFWLGAGQSVLWAVTRESFTAVTLPGRDDLTRQFRQFREEVERNGDAGELGSRLYGVTFGQAPRQVTDRPEWLISADEEPLNVPLAALRLPGPPDVRLGEVRAVSFLPSALWLFEPGEHHAPRNLLAVGGLVHNSADPRWAASGASPAAGNSRSSGALPRRTPAPDADLELPTLPGSAREVELIARLWKQQGLAAEQLDGFNASEAALSAQLEKNWTDLHFASHVLPAPAPRTYRFAYEPGSVAPSLIRFPAGESFLALSLRRDGVRDGLTERDLARFRLGGARVVLNGCSTGAGNAQRGAGLSSFANAWLAAGARSVVASLWPVEDDGVFFETYYRALLRGLRPAAALHTAQVAMIRSGTWRAQPRYWAAYLHLGKD